MKYIILVFLIGIGLGLWSKTNPSSNAYPYLLFKSKSQQAVKDGKYPLMIFLHGSGERGEDLELVKKHGPPKIVETDDSFPFYLISPQMPANASWKPERIMACIEEVLESNPIDRSRIYLTGLSMGGYGTWRTAFAYPDFFAALAPICGGDEQDAEKVALIKDVPVWAFHGDADMVVPEKGTAAIIAALKQVNSQTKYTVYPGVGHDSWTATYDNPDLYKWMLSHTLKK